MSGEWRRVLRALAEEQASEEALVRWDLPPGASAPINSRWDHVRSVVGLALELGRELDADLEVVEAAAWLHDIRKMEENHARAGSAAAAAILAVNDFPSAKIARVVQAIQQHEGLIREEGEAPLQPVEAAILWDADKLSKLGIGAVVSTAIGFQPAGGDLWERLDRLDEFTLRVLGQTVASMNTAPGRRRARERYARMVEMLTLWRREMNEQRAPQTD